MGFIKGQNKPAKSGIKKGQKQTRTIVKKRVHDLLADAGKHPVQELLKLVDHLAPKEAARVWLELLQYIEPKLSAQAITVDDKREQDDEDVIDVTPVSTEELLKQAKPEGE